jgi:hypothetical protein
MGDYHLKTHMLFISKGGCDIVFGVESLHTLGPIIMDYQELYMIFTQEDQTYNFVVSKKDPLKSSTPTRWKKC